MTHFFHSTLCTKLYSNIDILVIYLAFVLDTDILVSHASGILLQPVPCLGIFVGYNYV